jgi:ABC-type antimicrobial peptide transport system permease subunit
MRHTALDQPPAPDIYLPLRQTHRDRVAALATNQFWVIKTTADPAAFARTFIAHLRAVDADAAVSGQRAMRQTFDAWLGPRRFTLSLLGAFAATTVALAVFGVYGLVAFAVAERSREIGLRMAIGASRRQVTQMVLGHAARLTAIGAAVGLIAASALGPLVTTWFTGIEVDPKTVTIAIVLLVAAVAGAASVPARRAGRVDPVVALRVD